VNSGESERQLDGSAIGGPLSFGLSYALWPTVIALAYVEIKI
jgi:hypothetical protein